MSRFFGIFAFLLSAALIFPSLSAQEKKADDKGDVKGKKAKGKDDPKGEDDDPKKDPKDKKEVKKDEEKFVHGQIISGKLKKYDVSARDYTIEIPVIDPKKVFDLNSWKGQQMANLSQQYANVVKTFKPIDRQNALLNYNKAMSQYQFELAKRQTNIYSNQDYDVHLSEKGKIRSLTPPLRYDDRGNLITYTKKELDKMRAGSKLPGFEADVDDLKAGQAVQFYMAKGKAGNVPGQKEKDKKKGIKLDDEEPVGNPNNRPEAVLIVIQQP